MKEQGASAMNTAVWAIVACVIWASAFAVAKVGFEYVPPILLSGMRFALAGLILIPLILIRRESIAQAIRQDWRFMTIFALVQTFMQYGLFYVGLDKVPASISAIVIGAGPLFIALMAHWMMPNEKLTLRKVVAIAAAITGVVFISATKGGMSISSSGFFFGLSLLLLSNIIGGYANIMVAKHKRELSPVILTAFANFVGGVLLLIVGAFFEKFPTEPLPMKFYFTWLWLAFIPAAGFSIWYTLLKRPGIKVSDLNMWKFIIPVVGCILSWIMLADENPNYTSVVGILIITLSLQIYQTPTATWLKLWQRIKGRE